MSKYAWTTIRATSKHINNDGKPLCNIGKLRVFERKDLVPAKEPMRISARFKTVRDRVWKRLQALGVCDKCQDAQRRKRKAAA